MAAAPLTASVDSPTAPASGATRGGVPRGGATSAARIGADAPLAGATPAELAALAAAADVELATADAVDVLRWAGRTFGAGLVVTSAMGDALLPALAAQACPGVDVVFLDTGYHFAETLGTRDAVAAVYDVTVRTVLPLATVAEQDAAEGPELWRRDPDRCCALRKVEPLARALSGRQAWATGLRRDESATRAATPVVGFDARRGLVKIAPIATWSAARADAYVAEHRVLVNPLVSEGYLSIGCAPCTRAVRPGEDPRAGRWAGTGKTECGLHT